MKKKALIWISVLLIILISIIVGIILYNNNPSVRYKKQIELAQRYLTEGDMEQAIVAYRAAIEIDPRNPDTYDALADIYIGEEQWSAAKETLLAGVEATGATTLTSKLEEVELKIKSIAYELLDENIENIYICGDKFIDMTSRTLEENYARFSSYAGDDRVELVNNNIDMASDDYKANTRHIIVDINRDNDILINNVGVAENQYTRYAQIPEYFCPINLDTSREDVVNWCIANNLEYTENDNDGVYSVWINTEKYKLAYVIFEPSEPLGSNIYIEIMW